MLRRLGTVTCFFIGLLAGFILGMVLLVDLGLYEDWFFLAGVFVLFVLLIWVAVLFRLGWDFILELRAHGNWVAVLALMYLCFLCGALVALGGAVLIGHLEWIRRFVV